jgi:hypothetical protein
MLVVATEMSASDAELLEMRKTVQQVFDKQEETKEEVVDEKKRDLDGNDDGSGDDNSNDSDDDDSDNLPETWTTEEGHTATRAKNYSCSGVWKDIANPRRPTGPEAAGVGVASEHRKGHRARAAARARSKTPVRKRLGAVTRGVGLTLMFMLTVVSPLVGGLPLSSESVISKAVAREFCGSSAYVTLDEHSAFRCVPVVAAPVFGACASAVGS